jgi:hypothetical protein
MTYNFRKLAAWNQRRQFAKSLNCKKLPSLLFMKYLYVFILLVVIISCKKTEIEQLPEFPSTLYLHRVSIKSKIRLYSDKKEIMDKVVIDRFLKRNGGFRLKDSSFVSDEHIKFFSPDFAEMPNSFNSLLITKNDKQLIFKSTNRLIVTKEAIQSSYNMSKYRSEVEPVWDSKFSTYNMLVGYGNYSELNLSVFEYRRVSWNTFYDPDNYYLYPQLYRGSSSGTRFNEFDESYASARSSGISSSSTWSSKSQEPFCLAISIASMPACRILPSSSSFFYFLLINL